MYGKNVTLIEIFNLLFWGPFKVMSGAFLWRIDVFTEEST